NRRHSRPERGPAVRPHPTAQGAGPTGSSPLGAAYSACPAADDVRTPTALPADAPLQPLSSCRDEPRAFRIRRSAAGLPARTGRYGDRKAAWLVPGVTPELSGRSPSRPATP